jgi:hypothetical protein
MFYESAKSVGAPLEIIFLSSDRSEAEMHSYYKESHGSWLAVPYFSQQRQFLSQHFNVRGIPSLILLNRGTLKATEVDVRMLVQQAAMSGTEGIKGLVRELCERSGSVVFESIPHAMSLLTSDDRSAVFDLVCKIVANIADHPTESKYRQLKADNATVRKTILDRPCGDAPLRAIGFLPDGQGSYMYRPSLLDPFTAKLVLQNRESNGLSILAVSARVGTTAARPLPPTPSSKARELKFRILFRDMTPQTTDLVPISDGLDVIKAIVESITDVPSEEQIIFCPSVQKEGPLDGSDPSLLLSKFELFQGSVCDLIVLGQHTRTNPLALAESDGIAHKKAQELREKFSNISVNQSLLTDAIQAQIYEVPSHQKAALNVIPVADLHALAVSRLKQGIPVPELSPPWSYEECLFVEVLNWFKTKYFTWMDKPRCSECGAKSTVLSNGGAPPTPEEAKGLASRVEVYSCSVCGSTKRFPRYNHPVALLTTRTGRCGEWSNCFALIARALGFEIRRIHDSADHVWNEVWMEHRMEWMHADPCENAYAKPLLYSLGWGKKPTWTVAVAKDGIVDVTRRYCPDPNAIPAKKENLFALNEVLQSHWADGNALQALKQRDQEEESQLAKIAQIDRTGMKDNLAGRTTGSEEWRTQRGEMGTESKLERLKKMYKVVLGKGKTANEAAVEALRRINQ